jgi:hypothetical protein
METNTRFQTCDAVSLRDDTLTAMSTASGRGASIGTPR